MNKRVILSLDILVAVPFIIQITL